jgi:hypothetical protein
VLSLAFYDFSQSIREKSKWGAIAYSSLVASVAHLPSDIHEGESAREYGLDVGPLNVVDLDYKLYDDKRLYRDRVSKQGRKNGGFTRSLPHPFTRQEEKLHRDSLLWVAYASQPQRVLTTD